MNRSSILWRAGLAILLMLGFYALALGVVAVCWGGVALMLMGNTISVKLFFLLIIAGGVVLWSVLPRWDRFVAPGPRLAEGEHPRLFAELNRIATETGQPVPHDVYLVSDVNAFVANRGGIMGIGSRPVMGLGLPLLQTLSVPEMSAVIAHEFGHYVGGDTRLGPWIYKTRAALARSVENLASAGSLLTYPFLWYMKLFLRVTHAISRWQEYQADAVSAKVTSATDAGRALRKVHAIAPAYDAYWRTEVEPLLSSGHRPPIAAGFASFLGVDRVATLVRESLSEAPEANADPYDTHPPLAERLRALGQLDARASLDDDRPAAITLLGDVGRAEDALIGSMLRPGFSVKPVSWDAVGPAVYPPLWAEAAAEKPAVAALSPAGVRDAAHDPVPFVRGVADAGVDVTEDMAARAVGFYGGSVLGRALLGVGYAVESLPGCPVMLRRAEESVSLDELVLAARTDDAAAWAARLAALGLDAAEQERPNRARG